GGGTARGHRPGPRRTRQGARGGAPAPEGEPVGVYPQQGGPGPRHDPPDRCPPPALTRCKGGGSRPLAPQRPPVTADFDFRYNLCGPSCMAGRAAVYYGAKPCWWPGRGPGGCPRMARSTVGKVCGYPPRLFSWFDYKNQYTGKLCAAHKKLLNIAYRSFEKTVTFPTARASGRAVGGQGGAPAAGQRQRRIAAEQFPPDHRQRPGFGHGASGGRHVGQAPCQ